MITKPVFGVTRNVTPLEQQAARDGEILGGLARARTNPREWASGVITKLLERKFAEMRHHGVELRHRLHQLRDGATLSHEAIALVDVLRVLAEPGSDEEKVLTFLSDQIRETRLKIVS